MNKKTLESLGARLLVTFVEGFFGAWAAAGFRTDKLALSGIVASAISLAWNTVLKPALVKIGA